MKPIIIGPKIGPENKKYTQKPEYTQEGNFGYYRISTQLSRVLFCASDNRVFALSDLDFCYFSDNFPRIGTIYQKSVSEISQNRPRLLN